MAATLLPRDGCLDRLRTAGQSLVTLAKVLEIQQPIVAFDLEGTGELPDHDRIVEIAVVKVRPDLTVTTYATLVNPRTPIPAESTAVHQITDAMVAEAPAFADLAPGIARGFAGCILLAYNPRAYDIRLLNREFAMASIDYDLGTLPVLDPFSIYQQRSPRDLSTAYEEYCGCVLEGAHGAGADVEATVNVLLGQMARYTDLPTDVTDLVAYCDRKRPGFVDRAGKFRRRGDTIIVAFGRHAGTPLTAVDTGLLHWILSKDFEPDTMRVAQEELDRRCPPGLPLDETSAATEARAR